VDHDARRELKCIQGLNEQDRQISFVLRYLLKNLTSDEVTALSNAGLPIVSCYENTAGEPAVTVFTRAKGINDAKDAFARAQRLGQPAGTPIYFAIDNDADPTGPWRTAVLDYFTGVQEGCAQYLADMQEKGLQGVAYDIGVYGAGCVLDWCRDQGIATWFWQSFAPGWCGNDKVWEGANLRTWRLDRPAACSSRLDHIEGWGNEGGWTVTAAAQGQSLSVLLPAPPATRKYARGQAVDLSPRLIANSAVNTTTGSEGNITWELDQFPGMKRVAQSSMAPAQSAETIHLSNWPYCDHANGSRASAWFTVDWKFSGQAVGEVRITPSGTQQGPYPLRVEARIEDGKDRDANIVAMLVRFTYHFSTAEGSEAVATTDLILYSDGSIDQRSNWMAQAAA